MGCWVETCALTRMPIVEGDPVRVWQAFGNVSHQSDAEGGVTPPVLGLPILAEYNGQGGYRNASNPSLQALTERALNDNRYYRACPVSRGAVYVARDMDALFAVERELAIVFYSQLGIRPADLHAPSEPTHRRLEEASARAKAALGALLDQLAQVELPQDQAVPVVQGLVEACFGIEQGWFAWQILESKLFARPYFLLMHEAAYQALVREMGERSVSVQGDPDSPMTLREYMGAELDRWVEAYQARVARANHMGFAADSDAGLWLPRSNYLQALTRPWLCGSAPFVSHFWGAATPAEVLEAVPRGELIEFFVFQWARRYLRVDFAATQAGFQNEESLLQSSMMEATVKAFEARGRLKRDYGRDVA